MGKDGKARFSDHDYLDVWKVKDFLDLTYYIVYMCISAEINYLNERERERERLKLIYPWNFLHFVIF